MIKIENVEVYGWEAVKGFERLYKVSPNGEIYSVRSDKILSSFIAAGYKQVELNLCGRASKHLIHRLVAEAYLPNPKGLPCVNHKDGDKLNNNVSNLEWCTYKENMEHASTHGLLKTVGCNNPASKLTEEDVRYIRKNYIKGDRQFGSVALGKKFNVDHKAILCIVNGITWGCVK